MPSVERTNTKAKRVSTLDQRAEFATRDGRDMKERRNTNDTHEVG
jgi:hypothetical protein